MLLELYTKDSLSFICYFPRLRKNLFTCALTLTDDLILIDNEICSYSMNKSKNQLCLRNITTGLTIDILNVMNQISI